MRSGRRGACLLALAAACATLLTPLAAQTVAVGLHYGRDDAITQYNNFGSWLGRKVLYRVTFADYSSWDGIAAPWFLSTSRAWINSDPKRVEVLTLAMIPKGNTAGFGQIIRGERDHVFAEAARRIDNLGIASRVIIRLGWEGNGDWYPWAYANDPAGYRSAFRRIVQVMRKEASTLRFEWNVSYRCSRRGGPAHWTEGYPGDDVVDIISMDVYDEWNTWTSLRDGEAGLKELRDFAIAHNKPEAYSEWSCSTKKTAGGGDNPAFIANMAAWMAARPGGVLYQAYWNVYSGGPNGAVYGSVVNVPKAAAAFKSHFSFPSAPSSLAVE